MIQTWRKVRSAIRREVGRHPAAFYPIHRLRQPHRESAVTRDCDIVIEGFPRSANSFAYRAFQMAQARPVRVAHHLHVPAQIIRAVSLRLPTILLVRDPRAAVLSLLVRDPAKPRVSAVKEYVSYYTSVEGLVNDVVVAEFSRVTEAYGEIIREVNHRWGTEFQEWVHSEDRRESVFRKLEEKNRELGRGLEAQVPRPSAEREEMKGRVEGECMDDAEFRYHMAMALRVYRRVLKSGRR